MKELNPEKQQSKANFVLHQFKKMTVNSNRESGRSVEDENVAEFKDKFAIEEIALVECRITVWGA